MKYKIIDITTKDIVATYTSKARARAKRDRLDLVFGRVNYVVKAVEA